MDVIAYMFMPLSVVRDSINGFILLIQMCATGGNIWKQDETARVQVMRHLLARLQN